MAEVYEFYNLGIGDPMPVSVCESVWASEILLDAVTGTFPARRRNEEEEDERPRVAIVGKPNVGKSSLINKLLGEQRLIVSDIAGTTRDAVDAAVILRRA